MVELPSGYGARIHYIEMGKEEAMMWILLKETNYFYV